MKNRHDLLDCDNWYKENCEWRARMVILSIKQVSIIKVFDVLTVANRSHMRRLLTKRINLCLHLAFTRLSQLVQLPQ